MSEETSSAAFTATLKAGADYASPWLVVRADTPQELEANLDAATEDLLQKINDVASLFQGTRTVVTPTATSSAQSATVTQGGGADLKTCNHGVRTKRTGTSSRGPWTGWFCPQPKGSADQCKAIFE